MATVGILVVGLVAVVWFTSPAERERRGVMEELELGDPTSRVTAMLGAPAARCPGSELEHLSVTFPPGWPASSVAAALTTMEEQTRERWVFPMGRGDAASCAPRDGQTEIGIGPEGRVLWYVAVTGKTPLRLPDEIAPATPTGGAQ